MDSKPEEENECSYENEDELFTDKKEESALNFDFTIDQKVYWTEEQERAVIDYLWLNEAWLNNKIKWEKAEAEEFNREIDSNLIFTMTELIETAKAPESKRLRDKIFRDKLEKAVNKLVENIIFSFKLFRGDVDVKTLESDSLSFLMTKFANFDPSQKTKAFSFYGTILKHYLIGEKKNNYKDQQSNLDFEGFKEEANNKNNYCINEPSHLEQSSKLFNFIIDEIKAELKNSNISDNDKKVGNAIIGIFENHEKIQIYSKNNLYQMIKEYTNLQTKDITYSLSRFKAIYRLSKQGFINKNK